MGGTQVWLFLLWAPNIFFFLILCQVSTDVIILRMRGNMLRPSDCLHVICCSCLVLSALGIELRASVILDKHLTAEIWPLLFVFTQGLFKLHGWPWNHCLAQAGLELVILSLPRNWYYRFAPPDLTLKKKKCFKRKNVGPRRNLRKNFISYLLWDMRKLSPQSPITWQI